jgi:hypothetical protein
MTEEDTNELIRYETVTSPGLRTYWKIHFAQGSDAGQTELREVRKTPLGRVGRAALASVERVSRPPVLCHFPGKGQVDFSARCRRARLFGIKERD